MWGRALAGAEGQESARKHSHHGLSAPETGSECGGARGGGIMDGGEACATAL